MTWSEPETMSSARVGVFRMTGDEYASGPSSRAGSLRIVFHLCSPVFVSMEPQSGVSEAVINVLDENGNVVATIDDDVGGTTVSTSFAVVDLQVFFLALTVEVAGTNYVLDVVGV